jgi:hypothetical protein
MDATHGWIEDDLDRGHAVVEDAEETLFDTLR